MLQIYIDADACPVKGEVYRVAKRYRLNVTLVSNAWIRTPESASIQFQLVDDAPDAADDWIAEQVQQGDIVITGDIPLANRAIEKGAEVIGNTGRGFSPENIGHLLATRDLMTDLRGAGERTGGPPPMTAKDRSRFLQSLDAAIQRIQRNQKEAG